MSEQELPKKYRQPLVAVLGHVDSGKTTLLDYIRKTRVAAKEPGSITQHVGASEVPADVIEKVCEPVFKALGVRFELKTKGLLFIDLPGHEVFSNLRRRGGSVADVAILVVDVMGGVQPQTVESINILKERRTPFVIALNKIDLISGWKNHPDAPFIESIKDQPPRALAEFDRRFYTILGQLAELGINADRYDRITDFTKTFAVVPISAVTGEGVPDLLAVLLGLVQRFMLDQLEITSEEGKGVVLEVKTEHGLGTVVTAIIYDGEIRVGDTIVLAGLSGPIVTKVRALFRPRPLDEMRAPRAKFQRVESASAAAGVMISAVDLDGAIAGSPLLVVRDPEKLEEAIEAVREEVGAILIKTDRVGVIAKADTLGTLEALVTHLQSRGIPVRRADIGPVTKTDVFEAHAMKSDEPKYAVVLAFNVKITEEAELEAKSRGIPIFHDVIIYQLIERFEEYLEELKRKEIEELLSTVVYPAEIKVLPEFIFRRSDPAIVGVEVIRGKIRPGYPLINETGRRVGVILDIQDRGVRKPEAKAGDKVAISIKGGVVGRGIKPGRVLYTEVFDVYDPKKRAMFFAMLSEEEKELFRRILALRRGK